MKVLLLLSKVALFGLASVSLALAEAVVPAVTGSVNTLDSASRGAVGFVLGSITRLLGLLWRPKLPETRLLLADAALAGIGSAVAVFALRWAQEAGISVFPRIPEVEWFVALVAGYLGAAAIFKYAETGADALVGRVVRQLKKPEQKEKPK